MIDNTLNVNAGSLWQEGSPRFGKKNSFGQENNLRSSKKNVLTEYNALFKRKEETTLVHKWESDDSDECADIAGSSSDDGAQMDRSNGQISMH